MLLPIISKLAYKAYLESAKFLKRDFFEIKFIKDPKKQKEFFEKSAKRSLDTLIKVLALHNQGYGIIHDNVVLKESPLNYYWILVPLDNFANFASNIPLWGISINLVERHDCPIFTSFYMPCLDEFFYANKELGAFCQNKKMNLNFSNKALISNMNKFTQRILGSDLLHIVYCSDGRLDLIQTEDNMLNRIFSELFMQEVKGMRTVENNKIICGNCQNVSLF